MPKKRSLVVALLALLLLAAIVTGATLAYLTDVRGNSETRTVGKVSISLAGEGLGNTKRTDELFPGNTYVKKPYIAVDAKSQPCYVRLKVTIPQKLGAVIEVPTAKAGWKPSIGSESGTYYYTYQTVVQPDGKTPEAFDQITVLGAVQPPAGTTLSQMLADAAEEDIDIVAEAIQSAAFSSVDEAFLSFKP